MATPTHHAAPSSPRLVSEAEEAEEATQPPPGKGYEGDAPALSSPDGNGHGLSQNLLDSIAELNSETEPLKQNPRETETKVPEEDLAGLPAHLKETIAGINAAEEKEASDKKEIDPFEEDILASLRDGNYDPKPELGMGFFSRLENHEEQEKKRRKVEVGEQEQFVLEALAPPYTWMPVVDEFVLTGLEYSAAFVLPLVGKMFNYSTVGMTVAYTIVAFHTILTGLTHIGERSAFLRFPCSPLVSPKVHKLFDLLFVFCQVTSIALFPQYFGPNPYHAAVFIFCFGVGDVVFSYNSIVCNEEAEKEKKHDATTTETSSKREKAE